MQTLHQLEELPNLTEGLLKDYDTVKYLASLYYSSKDIFFIGRNVDHAISLEGALKLKEISYTHSEAYAAGGTEARPHFPHRTGHAGGGPLHLWPIAGEDDQQHPGSEGPGVPWCWRWRRREAPWWRKLPTM